MKKIVVISVFTLLVGCSSQYASNGEQLYLRSKNGPNVVVPPPMTDTNISHFYDLPEQLNKNPAVSIEPPATSIETKESM